jgi:hypothetical protein
MDKTLARIIGNHIHCYLKATKGPYGGTPGTYVNLYGSENATRQWLNDLRKMIYAFEEYQRYQNPGQIPSDIWERIHEGMQLFIDNYRDFQI